MSETMDLSFIEQRQVQSFTLVQKLFLIDFLHPSQKFFQALGWIDQGGIGENQVFAPNDVISLEFALTGWTNLLLGTVRNPEDCI
jgi:hypothetical protein